MSQDVTYDGWSFVNNGCVLTTIEHLTPATRTNQTSQLANRNGAKLTQSQLGTKPITIAGYFIGADIAAAQTMYDMLMSMQNRQERPLIVPHAGSTRQYTATPQIVSISEPQGLNSLTFTFTFVVVSGYSQETATTTLIDSTITDSTSSPSFSVTGSATCRPLIVLTFSSVTGGTSKSVTIRNGRDLSGLTFSRTFAADDVISIDSDALQIYINGVLTEPNGRIPTWEPGSGSLYYSDTLTTRSVSLLMTYNERNL